MRRAGACAESEGGRLSGGRGSGSRGRNGSSGGGGGGGSCQGCGNAGGFGRHWLPPGDDCTAKEGLVEGADGVVHMQPGCHTGVSPSAGKRAVGVVVGAASHMFPG